MKKMSKKLDSDTSCAVSQARHKVNVPLGNVGFRKSNSSTDFRHIQRRQAKALQASCYPCDKNFVLMQVQNADNENVQMTKDQSFNILQEKTTKEAGMKVLCTIMLNAWRKRRTEAQRLNQNIIHLKKMNIKTKHQLHVYNSLFNAERRHNEDLSVQIKQTTEDLRAIKSHSEIQNKQVESIKAEKNAVELQLQRTEEQVQDLKTLVLNMSADVERRKKLQHELQEKLNQAEQNMQLIQNEKNDYLDKLSSLTEEMKNLQNELEKEMETRNLEQKISAEETKKLQEEIETLKQKLCIVPEIRAHEEELQEQVDKCKQTIDTLERCLAATLGNRLKSCWNHALTCQRNTIGLLHLMAYYILPASTSPRYQTFPSINVTLEKALSVVRH